MPRAFLVKRFGANKDGEQRASEENYERDAAENERRLHSRHFRSSSDFGEFYSSEFKLRNNMRMLSQAGCVGNFISNPYFDDFVVASRGISNHRMFNIKNYQFLDFNKELIIGGCSAPASVTYNHCDPGDTRDSTDDSMDDSGDYDWCGEEYDSNNNSSKNGRSSNNNNSSNGIHCSFQYNSKDDVIHDDDSDECDSVYASKQAKNVLLRQHHHEGSHEKLKLGGKPQFQCTQCDKTFKTKYTLNIHRKMPSHTTLKPFVCPTCGKGFRLSSTLCRHKIIHTSQRPHRCHVCQKSFNRSSTLKTHLRTHSNVKEFTCSICGKGFHQKGNLRNHVLIHTGEKPYECNVCKKSFNKLSNLKFHMHSHTDQKPYRCRYCKQSFSKRAELKHHIALCKRDASGN